MFLRSEAHNGTQIYMRTYSQIHIKKSTHIKNNSGYEKKCLGPLERAGKWLCTALDDMRSCKKVPTLAQTSLQSDPLCWSSLSISWLFICVCLPWWLSAKSKMTLNSFEIELHLPDKDDQGVLYETQWVLLSWSAMIGVLKQKCTLDSSLN
jgi:hypothetical protein